LKEIRMFAFGHRAAWLAGFAAFFLSSASASDFQPERIYKVRKKISLDQGWKFINDITSTDPMAPSFNDASWATVNVPHCAKYAAPTSDAERATMPRAGGWTGVSWYRKTFTLPATGPAAKIFVEFEGAMSSADVYVNGTQAGSHMSGGFTGFWFDISSLVDKTGPNVLAVRLDCNYRYDVPPGKLDTVGNEYPDYQLYSGMHRDVWLVCADNVYIPLYGQKINTPAAASSRSTVRIRTTVNNDSGAAVTATVRCVVADKNGAIIAAKNGTTSINAYSSNLFDMTIDSITGVTPWTPETPELYRVFTKVIVSGAAVDDNAERFGFRVLDWKANDGFYLNGKRCELQGVNMHNEFAWVGHALPNSRYFQEVKLVKDMGANAIRCAHYPRDPSFYNACDELGVLCEPELPTWGGQTTSYPAAFWDRLSQAAQEMVTVGYNHPSIILWGIFNEPPLSPSFVNKFKTLHGVIKALDSSRFTSNINNKWYPPSSDPQNGVTDIHGLNYSIPSASTTIKVYNSEYAEGWIRWCNRGDTIDDTVNNHLYGENQFSDLRWSGNPANSEIGWTQIAQSSAIAGGHMWVFVDYWSANEGLSHPMGVLDHYRIPKKVYYTFQKNWTSASDDYPTTGLTAAKIRLDADVTSLVADSTDLSRIIASVRDNTGKCVWAAHNVTFQVFGPCNVFDDIGKPITTIAGKIGIILKSTNSPGAITVIASADNLASDTLHLTSSLRDDSPLPFIWSESGVIGNAPALPQGHISIVQTGERLQITAPLKNGETINVGLRTLQGRAVNCALKGKGPVFVVQPSPAARGIYIVRVKAGALETVKKIVLTN